MPILVPLAFVFLGWADPPEPTPEAGQEVVAALEMVLADAIAKAEPSVVAIAREKSENEETTAIRGRNPVEFAEPIGADEISFDYGSGVVIGDRGEILTAFHVVQGARRIKVRALGRQGFDAEIIAADPRSDLAVIVPREFPGVAPPKLKPIALGDATKLRKGSFLLALGNPFNAAGRDGRPIGQLGHPGQRRPAARGLGQRAASEGPAAQQLSDPAPARRQAEPRHERRRRDQHQGGTGRPDHHRANAAGFDALAGYAIPMDAHGPPRRSSRFAQGKEVEYGLLGIRLDPGGSNRVRDAAAEHARPARGACRPRTRSSPSAIPRSRTPTAWCWPSTPCPPALRSRSRSSAATRSSNVRVELAKFRVEGR